MKTNYKKLIVGAMGLVVGAGLVGSISGSVAWYQYSTRASLSYMGTSVHCTEALEISTNGTAWSTDLTNAQIQTAAGSHTGMKMQPVTEGAARAKDLAAKPTDFKANPIYQYFTYDKWSSAPAAAYLQYDVYVRVKDVNGAAEDTFISKAVYLADITVAANAKNASGYANAGVLASDFAKGLRFHITDGETGNLITTNDTDITTTLGGYLDLGGEAGNDKGAGYEWQETEATKYGDDTLTQVAAKIGDFDVDDSTPEFSVTGKTPIVTTNNKGDTTAKKLSITIWLEGWAELGTTPATIWDVSKYIHDFQIGMRFAVLPHADH